MATSGSYNFSTTRDTLITDALLYLGVIGEGETPSASAVTEAARMLNMLIKSWAADGMPLWSLKRGYILPFTGASSIASTSHVVTTYAQTTFSAAEAAGQTVLSLTNTTGMAGSDQIGLELDDGSVDWTTIVTVDSSVQVTVTTGLTSAAASGNKVYAYTASADRIQRPLRLFDVQLKDVGADTSNPINQVSRSEYFNLGDKTSEGTPNQLYYDPELANGTFYIFPRFQNGDSIIEFTFHRPFQDFDTAGDEPDCPQEFYLALTVGLASTLGPKYGVPSDERKALMVEAKYYRDEALSTIYAEGSVYLQPDGRGEE